MNKWQRKLDRRWICTSQIVIPNKSQWLNNSYTYLKWSCQDHPIFTYRSTDQTIKKLLLDSLIIHHNIYRYNKWQNKLDKRGRSTSQLWYLLSQTKLKKLNFSKIFYQEGMLLEVELLTQLSNNLLFHEVSMIIQRKT